MPQSRTQADAIVGVQGSLIEVAAHLNHGPATFSLVGLADTSQGEIQHRFRSAITSSGYELPSQRMLVQLTPSSPPKRGTVNDLAIAVAVLGATGIIPTG